MMTEIKFKSSWGVAFLWFLVSWNRWLCQPKAARAYCWGDSGQARQLQGVIVITGDHCMGYDTAYEKQMSLLFLRPLHNLTPLPTSHLSHGRSKCFKIVGELDQQKIALSLLRLGDIPGKLTAFKSKPPLARVASPNVLIHEPPEWPQWLSC